MCTIHLLTVMLDWHPQETHRGVHKAGGLLCPGGSPNHSPLRLFQILQQAGTVLRGHPPSCPLPCKLCLTGTPFCSLPRGFSPCSSLPSDQWGLPMGSKCDPNALLVLTSWGRIHGHVCVHSGQDASLEVVVPGGRGSKPPRMIIAWGKGLTSGLLNGTHSLTKDRLSPREQEENKYI